MFPSSPKERKQADGVHHSVYPYLYHCRDFIILSCTRADLSPHQVTKFPNSTLTQVLTPHCWQVQTRHTDRCKHEHYHKIGIDHTSLDSQGKGEHDEMTFDLISQWLLRVAYNQSIPHLFHAKNRSIADITVKQLMKFFKLKKMVHFNLVRSKETCWTTASLQSC